MPEFVNLDGLTCLIKVGAEADQNYQNYILRGRYFGPGGGGGLGVYLLQGGGGCCSGWPPSPHLALQP